MLIRTVSTSIESERHKKYEIITMHMFEARIIIIYIIPCKNLGTDLIIGPMLGSADQYKNRFGI